MHQLSTKADRVVQVASGAVIAYFLIRFVSSTIRLLLTNYIPRQQNGEVNKQQITGLMIMINIFIRWMTNWRNQNQPAPDTQQHTTRRLESQPA